MKRTILSYGTLSKLETLALVLAYMWCIVALWSMFA